MKTYKKPDWFKRVRGSYLPKSWQGALIELVYLFYIVWIAIYAWHNEYELWPAIFLIVPNWIAACVVATWVASKTSK